MLGERPRSESQLRNSWLSGDSWLPDEKPSKFPRRLNLEGASSQQRQGLDEFDAKSLGDRFVGHLAGHGRQAAQ